MEKRGVVELGKTPAINGGESDMIKQGEAVNSKRSLAAVSLEEKDEAAQTADRRLTEQSDE